MLPNYSMGTEWNGFFQMVGAGSAALAGLVFVAMSINLKAIVEDLTHSGRAVSTMTGLTAAFVLCGLALMGGQSTLSLGIEWIAVSVIPAFVYILGYLRARSRIVRRNPVNVLRSIAGVLCYLTQIGGAVLLILGYPVGLYISAIAMMAIFAILISGAWLLLVGICVDADCEEK